MALRKNYTTLRSSVRETRSGIYFCRFEALFSLSARKSGSQYRNLDRQVVRELGNFISSIPSTGKQLLILAMLLVVYVHRMFYPSTVIYVFRIKSIRLRWVSNFNWRYRGRVDLTVNLLSSRINFIRA